MNDIFGLLLLLTGYLLGSSNLGTWLHGSMTSDDDNEVKK